MSRRMGGCSGLAKGGDRWMDGDLEGGVGGWVWPGTGGQVGTSGWAWLDGMARAEGQMDLPPPGGVELGEEVAPWVLSTSAGSPVAIPAAAPEPPFLTHRRQRKKDKNEPREPPNPCLQVPGAACRLGPAPAALAWDKPGPDQPPVPPPCPSTSPVPALPAARVLPKNLLEIRSSRWRDNTAWRGTARHGRDSAWVT